MDPIKFNGLGSLFDTQLTSQINPALSLVQKADKPSNMTENIKLIEDLNHSLGQLNTTLRFRVDDESNVFYVAVIDTKTDEILRRFPLEELPNSAAIHPNASGIFLNTSS
ncbi:flagellar protein FlaG protein [Sulfuricurvum kujiense DSM 16994]|uniref:Flagellar protein FlaG protein n=1 Tax=Sulfuricurvum kujiense (strain ATCC BAA-921 / DSM 16994 / JCM 11577 / YK-1) TaxID=709032 RepID=E4U2C6_SULKY|nr:flagellar protein FlaG [Sulfuricurvum kujiense]ADR33576.1 flagellar protein FlaG protein [Sulfuricurvum kujiense DSM 16994]